jgi:hypothetical protein
MTYINWYYSKIFYFLKNGTWLSLPYVQWKVHTLGNKLVYMYSEITLKKNISIAT